MNQADIELMNSLKWYHKIELVGGRVTPGCESDHLWSPIKREMHRVDFRGKRVLDIGTWDGLWSFEAEGPGASSVLATDINTQRSFTDQGPATFEFAKRIRGSKVEYKEVSVHNLDSLEQQFDIVVFFGVLYHLRFPLLGLARIRNVLKDGGSCSWRRLSCSTPTTRSFRLTTGRSIRPMSPRGTRFRSRPESASAYPINCGANRVLETAVRRSRT
jgi:2-polyprenyl-3-methyl-5-hydroxy-6-metoxy-1,4-benzoquinol methylase